jgi:uncharacterized protein YjiS (DUF1127 family)
MLSHIHQHERCNDENLSQNLKEIIMNRVLSRPAVPTLPPFMAILRNFAALYSQRKSLAALDARMLDDIGVDALEARAEAQRPFWDVPCHWTR